MPDIPNRLCRMRQYASLSRCIALSAEMRGDGKEAARMTLDAMLLDARADWLDRHVFGECRA